MCSHDFQLFWNLWSSFSLSLVCSSSRGWKNWRNLLLNWLQVKDILMPLLMRLSLMWIRMWMTFCQLKLKNSASAIYCRHWWLRLVLLLCPFWRRYQLQCFGATLPSWPLKACQEINFGREYCIFSLLQVEDTCIWKLKVHCQFCHCHSSKIPRFKYYVQEFFLCLFLNSSAQTACIICLLLLIFCQNLWMLSWLLISIKHVMTLFAFLLF